MKVSDFILIQVNKSDEYYEVARVRPYFFEDGRFDPERGYYCEGYAQNNGRIYEFQLHLGVDENVKYSFMHLGGLSEIPYSEKVSVFDNENGRRRNRNETERSD